MWVVGRCCSRGGRRCRVDVKRVLEGLEWVKQCIVCGEECGIGMGITIYLRESLQSPKWLIPKVAQSQLPPSKKSEMYYVHFCVCPHTTRLKTEENRRRVVIEV